jgi:MipA family protein
MIRPFESPPHGRDIRHDSRPPSDRRALGIGGRGRRGISLVFPLVAVSLLSSAYGEGHADENLADTWQFSAGLGAINAPRYPGSKEDYTRVVPVLGAQYGRFFLGGLPGSGSPGGLGVNLLHDEHWQVGLGASVDFRMPRRASDDPSLRAWGDIAKTEHAAAFASYTVDWFVARGSINTDIGGKHEGTLLALGGEGRIHPTEALTFSAGPDVVFADKKYSETFFGVSAAQSAISGIPVYEAKAGLDTLRFSVGADYRLAPRWSVGAHVSYGRLEGDAGDSPITLDKTQRLLSVFTMFRF